MVQSEHRTQARAQGDRRQTPEISLSKVVKQLNSTTHTKRRLIFYFGEHTFLGKTTGPKSMKTFLLFLVPPDKTPVRGLGYIACSGLGADLDSKTAKITSLSPGRSNLTNKRANQPRSQKTMIRFPRRFS